MDIFLIVVALSLPVSAGWALSRFAFPKVSRLQRLLIFVAVGMSLGALDGTTYTHAFDILWWWKGLAFSLPLCVGGEIYRFRNQK